MKKLSVFFSSIGYATWLAVLVGLAASPVWAQTESAVSDTGPVDNRTVPGAPTGVMAVAGAEQAVVSFSAPPDDGGASITGYVVTASPGGVTGSGTASPITISGLVAGPYTFTVTASNALGMGSASTASAQVVSLAPPETHSAVSNAGPVDNRTVPGAPTGVLAVAGAEQAVVSFSAPSDDGGASITGYVVTASPGGATGSGTASPITISGLVAGAYTFTVMASNALGVGPASSASGEVVTLPPSAVPTISRIEDRTTDGMDPSEFVFTVSDAATPPGELIVSASSSNTGLVPSTGVRLSGTAGVRTLTVQPVVGGSGTSTITVTVQNAKGATASSSFVLTVTGGTAIPLGISDATGRLNTQFTPPEFKGTLSFLQFIEDGRGGILWPFGNGGVLNNADGHRLGLVRTDENGVVDTNFVVGPLFTSLTGGAVGADGSIFVAGSRPDDLNADGVSYTRIFRIKPTGELDVTYQSPPMELVGRFMAVQPDGRLIVTSGAMNTPGNGGLAGVFRLNTNGSLDQTFRSPTFGVGEENSVFAIPVIDSQGRILLGGSFTMVNGQSRPVIVRLLANGEADTTFNPSGFTTTPGLSNVRGIAVQADGRVVVGGSQLRLSGRSGIFIAFRLNADGSVDSSFTAVAQNTGGNRRIRMIRQMADGRLVLGGEGVMRLSASGVIDSTFVIPTADSLGLVSWIALLGGDKVLAGPGAVFSNPVANGTVCLNADGSLNNGFRLPLLQEEEFLKGAAVQPDGRILAWGDFDRVGDSSRSGLVRLMTDGKVDETFQLATTNVVNEFDPSWIATNVVGVSGVALLSDGRFYANVGVGYGGVDRIFAQSYELKRFLSDGRTDLSFTNRIPMSWSSALAGFQSFRDRLLYWQNSEQALASGTFRFERLTLDGAKSATFTSFTNRLGRISTNNVGQLLRLELGSFRVLAIDDATGGMIATISDGPVADSGNRFGFRLVRLNADGSRDDSFVSGLVVGAAGSVAFPAVQNPFTGLSEQVEVVYPPSRQPFRSAAFTADGRILVAGEFESIGSTQTPALARLLPSGSVDSEFSSRVELFSGSGQPLRAEVHSVRVDSRSRIWLTGNFNRVNGVVRSGLARLNPDGTLDASFDPEVDYYSFTSGDSGLVSDGNGAVFVFGTYRSRGDLWPSALHKLLPFEPPQMVTTPVRTGVAPGGQVSLNAIVHGSGPLTYKWWKDGVPLTDGERITGTSSGALRLDNIQASDFGGYSVVVSNSYGVITNLLGTLAAQVKLDGKIKYYAGTQVVPGVTIDVDGDGVSGGDSASDGGFRVTLAAGGTAALIPRKASDSSSSAGVTTLDITLIRRHILGLAQLDSSHKLLAADVNRSSSVSTLDITLIRRLILGLTNNFPSGLWTFVPSDHVFANPALPFGSDLKRHYSALGEDRVGQDFIGIKMGDVNGSWTQSTTVPPPPTQGEGVEQDVPSQAIGGSGGVRVESGGLDALRGPGLRPLNGGGSTAVLSLGDFHVGASGEIEVPVRLTGVKSLSGVQFTLVWNPAVMEFVRVNTSGLPGFGEGNVNATAVVSGRLSVSWDDLEGQGIGFAGDNAGSVLGSTSLSALGSASILAGSLSSAEANMHFTPSMTEWTGTSAPEGTLARGVELMRLTFRPRTAVPSAGVLRFGIDPTPSEVVVGYETIPVQTSDTVLWFGRSPGESSVLLPTLRGAPGSNSAELRVPTWIGMRSVIERTEDLNAKLWYEVGSIEGDGTVSAWPVTVPGTGQGYYRVRWEP